MSDDENRHGGVGYCRLAALRMYETIETGKPQTRFMRFGDRRAQPRPASRVVIVSNGDCW
ncbi:hypothetical protein GPA27_17470 [Aromatoleum toluolicum]|uniref:Uncharacterized protein n=1 Tax=Aromatoleum toluolicum TaxID=90060 RepID=A0ABX1NIM8_9RHOO|nr:hypothetical protein [Aromatoleum toluolicum]NMF99172.1 hypothetical protein [Aromatoleum toluolicum]